MKEVLFNPDNLTKEDIEEVVVRTKAIIVNSNNEILLGYCHKTYQFPGGHLEENESLNSGLIREVKEETGITLTGKLEPFFAIKYFLKDYPVLGNNRSIEIYYFLINIILFYR